MFDVFPHPLDDIASITAILAGIAVAIAYVWAQVRNGKSNSDTSTIAAYKSEIDALTLRVNRFESDNKILTAQINKLIGENQTLKEINSLRDPAFVSSITAILGEIKQLRKDFQTQNKKVQTHAQAHAKLDDKRFGELFNALKAKNAKE